MKPRNEMLLTIAAATLVATGFAATANADAKGNPNPRSVATVTACTVDSTTVRVCASKDLSNVVLQCTAADSTTVLVKFDDLEVGNVASFSCTDPVTQAALGDVSALWVKAGSMKTTGGPVPGNGTGAVVIWPGQCTDSDPADPCATSSPADL